MLVKRDTYLNELIERQNNGMVTVITGIRRCGKSFLLFKLYKEYLLNNGVTADHIIEIALDGIDADELRDPKFVLAILKRKSRMMKCILFCWMKFNSWTDLRRC